MGGPGSGPRPGNGKGVNRRTPKYIPGRTKSTHIKATVKTLKHSSATKRIVNRIQNAKPKGYKY